MRQGDGGEFVGKKSTYVLLYEWIAHQLRMGRSNFNLLSYLLTGIMFFGFTGIWMQLVKDEFSCAVHGYSDWITAFSSIGPAIAGASCMDLVLGRNEQKYLRSFAILSCIIIVALSWLAFLYQIVFTALASLFTACLLWLIVNASNQLIEEDVSYENSLGKPDSAGPTGTAGPYDIGDVGSETGDGETSNED